MQFTTAGKSPAPWSNDWERFSQQKRPRTVVHTMGSGINITLICINSGSSFSDLHGIDLLDP